MSRTGFGVNLGFRKNADGSISMSGPVDASGGIRIVQAGSKGMRIPFYRLANITNDALGYTYQTIISLEQHFDAIQLVIGTLQTSGTIRSAHYCNVIADENLTDAALNALSGWAFVDWTENDGNGVRAQFASFAAATSRPRLMLSDIKTFNSIDRTDGGAGALLVVRSHLYPDNLTPTLAGNGTNDVFANVARTDGRTMKIRRMNDHVHGRRGRLANPAPRRDLLLAREGGQRRQVWRLDHAGAKLPDGGRLCPTRDDSAQQRRRGCVGVL